MAATNLLDSAKADQKTLDNAQNRITRANTALGKAFAKWIAVVGPELLKARDVLSSRSKGDWNDWCESLGMSRQHVNRTIKAYETVKLLEPVGSNLPTSERQCRVLAKVEPKLLTKAWELITSKAETITEASIRSTLCEDKRFVKFFPEAKEKPTKNTIEQVRSLLSKLSIEERQTLLTELI